MIVRRAGLAASAAGEKLSMAISAGRVTRPSVRFHPAGTRTALTRRVGRIVVASVALSALLAATPASAASGPSLIKDLVPGSAGLVPGTSYILRALGSTVLVRADASNGRGDELWKTNATAAGTKFVKDINPGLQGSSIDPHVVILGTNAYFEATDATFGTELWKTDGTAAGTKLVKDVDTNGGEGSNAFPMAVMGGRVYFTASDGTFTGEHGNELWKTDGTAAGTKLVKDLAPGVADSGINHVAVLGSKLIFTANDNSGIGLQLFQSDGTAAGTKLLKRVNPSGDMIPYPGGGPAPAVAGGLYYFWASDGTGPGGHGFELWKTNGTTAGTKLVKDISPGTADTQVAWMKAVGTKVYFSAADASHGYELWVTDGTGSGTKLLRDIWPGPLSGDPNPLGAIGSTFYFSASDTTLAHGVELWKTNGTTAGTKLVRDINPGTGGSFPYDGVVIGTTLLFSANDGTHGDELWRSNGTAAGTKQVMDIWPGATGSEPTFLTRFGTKLVFFADDGVHGMELWTYTP